jgi:hypothetical protein
VSRPDLASAAEPRIPRAQRTVHRRPAPVPLRVVAQRLTPDQAQALAPQPAGPVVPPAPVTAHAPVAVPAAAPVSTADRGSLPVLDRSVRRRPPFARLLDLVTGRRSERCGRHRPDTLPSRGWSMFAPHRRARRRYGSRR